MGSTGSGSSGTSPLAELGDTPLVGATAARAYVEAADSMMVRVNRALATHSDLARLLGDNSFALFEDNHRNHVRFVGEMLENGHVDGLVSSLPWVYRAYLGRGVHADYFPIELDAWIEAIRAEIGDAGLRSESRELVELYEWMRGRHDQLLELAEASTPSGLDHTSPWAVQAEIFATQLLERDHRACLATCRTAIVEGATHADVFQHIVSPAMVDVGERWERGEIGAAEEHMCTAIVNSVLVSLAADAPVAGEPGGVAVVAAPAAEHHELGPWMVAACLESVGWTVVYLGSDLPPEEVAAATLRNSADLVALSVAMPFNVGSLRDTIEAIRRGPEPHPTIVIGGGAFARHPELVETVDADAYLSEAPEIQEFARRLAPTARQHRS